MKSSVNIIHSLYSPDIIGGAEISTQILAESLKRYMDVTVSTVGSHKQGIYTESINGVPVNRFPYHNLYWLPDASNQNKSRKLAWHIINTYNQNQYKIFMHYFRTETPSVVHTQNLAGLSVAVWKAAYDLHIPVVHTLRDYTLLKPTNSDIFSFFSNKITRHYSKYVSSVIGISDFILEKHKKEGFFKHAQSYTIPNALKSQKQSEELVDSKDAKALKIGYFGQLADNKGIEYLIKAVNKLSETTVQKLYICGGGPLKEELINLAKDNDRVIFTGKLKPEEVQDYMKTVDITVVPSVWDEPFGRVIIESYQVGTPVLASHVGGIPEIVTDTSRFCFPPANEDAIRERITSYFSLSAEDKKEVSRESLERSKKYSVENLVGKHLHVYSQLK